MRILVVEDETQLSLHISRALTRASHTVDICHDGAEGFERFVDLS